jgi:hypothetical protein
MEVPNLVSVIIRVQGQSKVEMRLMVSYGTVIKAITAASLDERFVGFVLCFGRKASLLVDPSMLDIIISILSQIYARFLQENRAFAEALPRGSAVCSHLDMAPQLETRVTCMYLLLLTSPIQKYL